MSNQPALTTSSGALWLILGGILAAIAIAEFAVLLRGNGRPIALAALVIEGGLYVTMVVVALVVPRSSKRLRLLAIGMIVIAVVAVIGLMLVIESLA
jgi:hypothetical protein